MNDPLNRNVVSAQSIPEVFGSMVFNDHVMRERLPKDTYKALKKTMELGKSLDRTIANVVANAMKEDVYKRQGRNPACGIQTCCR